MNTLLVDKNIELFEFDSFDAAQQAAAAAATSSFSQILPCVMYEQAQRVYFSTGFPLASVNGLVKFDSAIKGSSDPQNFTNRPILPDHVRSITEYLIDRERYILHGITLNVREIVKVYTTRTASPVRMAIIILPAHATFYVTDGQHRLKAVMEALASREDLRQDALPVTIVVEPDLDQIHQDFADCAQTRTISPALLTQYNRSDELSSLTIDVAKDVEFFKNRLERIGNTVSKRSTNFYTVNHVRMCVAALMTGNSAAGSAALSRATAGMLTTDKERLDWRQKIDQYLNLLTETIPEWKLVRDANVGLSTIPAVADFRSEWIHFSGTGLTIIGAVGYHIFKNCKDKPDQERKVLELAKLVDWKRTDSAGNPNPYWVGNIMTGDGKIVTSRSALQAAVNKVRDTLKIGSSTAVAA